jgi:hypothetical protein
MFKFLLKYIFKLLAKDLTIFIKLSNIALIRYIIWHILIKIKNKTFYTTPNLEASFY